MSGETISTKWKKWAESEPIWAYTALFCMMASFLSLGVHLGVLSGLWRTVGLIAMLVFAVLCELVLIMRKQLAWATYWGICVIGGVSLWELLSYFTNIFG